MIHNGHAPDDEIVVPKSVIEKYADSVIDDYLSDEIDVVTAFQKIVDKLVAADRIGRRSWYDNKRLVARNAYLEAEILRAQKRLRHMTYTPSYLSQGEIDSYARGQYVYVLHDVEVTGRYKIGKATLPRVRFAEFTKWPFRWQVICILPTKDMHTLERQLHDRYQHKRAFGTEWFTLSPTDVLDIVTHSEE